MGFTAHHRLLAAAIAVTAAAVFGLTLFWPALTAAALAAPLAVVKGGRP